MSDKTLPSVCSEHPKAAVRHSWDEDTYTHNGRLASRGHTRNDTYECAECGRRLCSPEEYSRRERIGGHFA